MVNENTSLKQFFLERVAVSTARNLPFSARYHAAAEEIVRRIALSLSRACGRSVQFVWPIPVRADTDYSSHFPAVQISFRVFGQRLKLYLPVEVATELCDGFLQSNSNFVLSELSEKEAIAIGYLAGLVLNDNTAFPKQRAYLQAVEIVEAVSPEDQQENYFFALPTKLNGSDSTILLSFENRLRQIFLENAARLAPLAIRRAWFASLNLSGRITAKIVIEDLHGLLAIERGTRLAVTVSDAHLELSQQQGAILTNSKIALSYAPQGDAKRIQLYL